MTPDKAIEIIGLFDAAYCGPTPEEIKEAVSMATKALEQEGYYKDLAQSYEKTIVKLTKAIAERKTCEERKTGKWEHGYSFPDGNYAKCTACGEIIKCTYPMHFCPNCGAKMEGEE